MKTSIKFFTLFITILFLNPVNSQTEIWKLDSRFATLNTIELINNKHPELQPKAEQISHYSGYYNINPFLLITAISNSNETIPIVAKKLYQVIHSKSDINQFLHRKLNKKDNKTLYTLMQESKAAMKNNHIMDKNKTANDLNMPALDLPFNHIEDWYFNGVHTWTGEDNGEAMSSIDMTRNWQLNWGANTDTDWVAASHDGMITKFSSCYLRITHESGWATDYYHLDNIQFETGDSVNAGTHIANYANNLNQALCQGGSSTGPHVHFSLVKDGERESLSSKALSKWNIHPGNFSYDSSPNRMWLERDDEKKHAYQSPIKHLNGDNEIDYRYSGAYSLVEIGGHGIEVTITNLINNQTSRNVVFVTFYTYDDDGNTNFYAGNIDFDNWRIDESKTVNMFQTNGGNFSDLLPVDFETGVTEVGTIQLYFQDCSTLEVNISLLEPTTNQKVNHELVLSKLVGTPNFVCLAPSIIP